MKWLSLLLTFYFFALALMPCVDRVECEKFEKQKILEIPNQADYEHAFEMCSPFCVCSCCGIQLVFIGKINFILETILHFNAEDAKKSFYTSHFLNNYLSEIWQPPKFVNV